MACLASLMARPLYLGDEALDSDRHGMPVCGDLGSDLFRSALVTGHGVLHCGSKFFGLSLFPDSLRGRRAPDDTHGLS